MGEGLAGQATPQRLRHAPVRREGLAEGLVVLGVDHHREPLPVLGRRPDHGRAADVDVLHRVLVGAVGLLDHPAEGIEVHDHEVDGRDVVLPQLGLVGRRRSSQNPTVDPGVQGLDPAVQDLRCARVVADLDRRDPELAQRPVGPTGGEHLHFVLDEQPSQPRQVRLVTDTHQGATDRGAHDPPRTPGRPQGSRPPRAQRVTVASPRLLRPAAVSRRARRAASSPGRADQEGGDPRRSVGVASEVRQQLLAAGLLELHQASHLDLPDPLAGQVEDLADLFEGDPPCSATSRAQLCASSQTSRSGKLILMLPVFGFTSMYRWYLQLT